MNEPTATARTVAIVDSVPPTADPYRAWLRLSEVDRALFGGFEDFDQAVAIGRISQAPNGGEA